MTAATCETWRSKCGNKYAKKDIDTWDLQLKAELSALRRASHNRKCFDCGADDCTWASPKLGIFICNFNTYLWGPDELEVMKAVGNKMGKELYGADVVSPSDSKESKVANCTKKYGSTQTQEIVQHQVFLASERAAALIAAGTPCQTNSAKLASVEPRSATTGRHETSCASQKPVQDLLTVEFVPEVPLTAHESVRQTVKMNSIDMDSFWDSFDTMPIVGGSVDSTGKSSRLVTNTTSSKAKAKELFDDLDDFWASA